MLHLRVIWAIVRALFSKKGRRGGPSSTTTSWTGRQLLEAAPWDTAPRYMLRDRDGIYGHDFMRCVHALVITRVMTAPRPPWQNRYVERLIGSIGRECLEHVIVLNEDHLRRIRRRRAPLPATEGALVFLRVSSW